MAGAGTNPDHQFMWVESLAAPHRFWKIASDGGSQATIGELGESIQEKTASPQKNPVSLKTGFLFFYHH